MIRVYKKYIWWVPWLFGRLYCIQIQKIKSWINVKICCCLFIHIILYRVYLTQNETLTAEYIMESQYMCALLSQIRHLNWVHCVPNAAKLRHISRESARVVKAVNHFPTLGNRRKLHTVVFRRIIPILQTFKAGRKA